MGDVQNIVKELNQISFKNKWERVTLLTRWLDVKAIPYTIYNMNSHIKIVHKDYRSIDVWPTTIRAHIFEKDLGKTLDSWKAIITFLNSLDFSYEPNL